MSAVVSHPGKPCSKYLYRMGCRCDGCREASRVATKASRDKARAANAPSYQRALAASRALKATYRGTCEDCGAETRYNGQRSRVSRWCVPCGQRDAAASARSRRAPSVTRRHVYELPREPRRFSEITRELGVSHGYAAPMTHRELAAGRIERISRGVYRLPVTA